MPVSKVGVGLSSDSNYAPAVQWLGARVDAAIAAGVEELHTWVDRIDSSWVPELHRFVTGGAEVPSPRGGEN